MNILRSKSNKKPKQFVNQNPIEAIVSVGSGVKDSALNDLGKASVNDAWDQLLGLDPHEAAASDHGELSEGAELNLAEIKDRAHEITEAGREFAAEVIHAGKRAQSENSQEISVKIQEILIEIRQLSKSSGQLRKQVEIVTVEQIGENPGVYHVNFLEQMLSTIRDLRASVEDSLAWFSALRSKKASRQYGVLAKKHGTSFTLSNERQVATQVG